jgi:hypothetical protein
MSKLYTNTAIDNLISWYELQGGDMTQITEGSLGHGLLILRADGFKSVVVQEVYINEWSSGHKVTRYNVLPKKYQEMLTALV